MTEQPEPPTPAEVLAGAEAEMVDDEVGFFRELMGAAVARMPADRELSEDEMRAEIERLIAEEPRLREVAERLAVRNRFRDQDR
jgi:hypothetical protein